METEAKVTQTEAKAVQESKAVQTKEPPATVRKAPPEYKDGSRVVEENLEDLRDVLLSQVQALRPDSMKVYTDVGLYLPFNAHMAYYGSADAVLDDLALLADVWERGLPGYSTPPLKAWRPGAGDGDVFHEWRDDQQQAALWRALAEALPAVRRVTADHVEWVYQHDSFSTYAVEAGGTKGKAVLHYPDFLNGFVDGFYLAVLQAALSGGTPE